MKMQQCEERLNFHFLITELHWLEFTEDSELELVKWWGHELDGKATEEKEIADEGFLMLCKDYFHVLVGGEDIILVKVKSMKE